MSTSLSFNERSGVLELRFPFDPTGNRQAQAKQIYGYKWNSTKKCWEYPPTADTARQIVRRFDPSVGAGFKEWWERAQKEALAAERAHQLAKGEVELEGDLGLTWVTEPYAAQYEYLEWAAFRNRAGLLFRGCWCEQGFGKTKVEIDLSVWELENGYCTGAPIVFCPASVKQNWVDELFIHAPQGYFHPIVLTGTATERISLLEQIPKAASAGMVPFVITNYDVLAQPSQRGVRDMLISMAKAGRFGKVMLDEASLVRNVQSNRGRFIYQFSRHVPIRTTMTATPYPKRPTDVFGVVRNMSTEILGASWPAFRKHHVIYGGWQNREVVGYKNLEELEARIAPHVFRRLLDECTDMPEEVHARRTCELTKKQIQVTKELKKQFLSEMEGEDGEAVYVNATEAMTRLLRFNQITSGFLENRETGQHAQFKPNPKLDLLIRILQEEVPENEKAVIWCCYQEDVRRIKAALREKKIGAVSFYGEDSDQQRQKNEKAFKEDEKTRVMIATPDAGGFGLNWQVACHCIFYSYGFNWEALEQARARIRRITQKKRMFFTWLVAENPETKRASHGVSSGVNAYILENLDETSKLAKLLTGDARKAGVDPSDELRRALEVV